MKLGLSSNSKTITLVVNVLLICSDVPLSCHQRSLKRKHSVDKSVPVLLVKTERKTSSLL